VLAKRALRNANVPRRFSVIQAFGKFQKFAVIFNVQNGSNTGNFFICKLPNVSLAPRALVGTYKRAASDTFGIFALQTVVVTLLITFWNQCSTFGIIFPL
jgi:hypothetical protein